MTLRYPVIGGPLHGAAIVNNNEFVDLPFAWSRICNIMPGVNKPEQFHAYFRASYRRKILKFDIDGIEVIFRGYLWDQMSERDAVLPIMSAVIAAALKSPQFKDPSAYDQWDPRSAEERYYTERRREHERAREAYERVREKVRNGPPPSNAPRDVKIEITAPKSLPEGTNRPPSHRSAAEQE